jgi:U3 small nucleolar RNA-associated protein 23
MGDAKDVVVKYLGAPAKLFTTRCVQHELRNMGVEFKDASFASRRCEAVAGGPDPPARAFDSIVEAVGGENAERFLVCTQDETLRRKLAKKHVKVPVIFCHTSGLHMEPPADALAKDALASQAEVGAGLSDPERAALGQDETARDVNYVRTNVRYAKPKARGPNPLASKKKQVKAPRMEAERIGDGGGKKKRKRRGAGGADS